MNVKWPIDFHLTTSIITSNLRTHRLTRKASCAKTRILMFRSSTKWTILLTYPVVCCSVTAKRSSWSSSCISFLHGSMPAVDDMLAIAWKNFVYTETSTAFIYTGTSLFRHKDTCCERSSSLQIWTSSCCCSLYWSRFDKSCTPLKESSPKLTQIFPAVGLIRFRRSLVQTSRSQKRFPAEAHTGRLSKTI